MKTLLAPLALLFASCAAPATPEVAGGFGPRDDEPGFPTDGAPEEDHETTAGTDTGAPTLESFGGDATGSDAAGDDGQAREVARSYAGTVSAIVHVQDDTQSWDIPCDGSFLLDVAEDGSASGAGDCQSEIWQVDSVGIIQGTVSRGQMSLSWTLSVWGQQLDVTVTGEAIEDLDGALSLQDGDWSVVGNMAGRVQ